ncbi:MAG: hypothetical protein V1484_02670 [bacterium]
MPPEINTPDNTEIDKALREFELKNQTEQAQKAPEVPQDSDVPKMVQLVMKWSGGAIKEQKQAEYVLLGFVILAISISLFLVFLGGNSGAIDLKQQKLYPPGSSVLQ